MNKNISIILILTLLFTPFAFAKLTAEVDRTDIVIGETFNLNITIDKNVNDEPDLTKLGTIFRILGNNLSSSTQIINGQYSTEKSWQVVLMASNEGSFTIPPIYLNGENTQPIQITVSKADPNAKADGDIFIELSTDKTEAYVKEQIVLTVKLFYSIALSEGGLSEPIAKDTLISMMDKSSSYNTQRDGKTYTVVERHYSMFAEKNGTLELNPIIFNGKDNSSRRNFSMFSTGKPIRAVSKPLSIEIKPIPQQALGKEWLPASKVQISQQWSNGPYTAGEPITRTITLYVEGLTETQIPEIELGEIDHIKVYPEQPQSQTENTSTTIKSVKQVKMALIPTHEGAIRIPEYSLQWFNTQTQEFEFAKLPPMTLQVQPGAFAMDNPNIQKQLDQMSPLNSETLSIKDNPTEENSNQIGPQVQFIPQQDNYFWQFISAIFLLLWIITLYLYFKKPKEPASDPIKSKPIEVSKKNIIAAVNAKNIYLLQKNLIAWWNQQYSKQKITNLSQLQNYLQANNYQVIQQLQDCMYTSSNTDKFDFEAMKNLVNSSNGLKLDKVSPTNHANPLPQLY
jgi:hypothetical protein